MGINNKANGFYQYKALDHQHGEKNYGADKNNGFDYYNAGPVYGYDYGHINHHYDSQDAGHGHYHADHHHQGSQM